MNRKQTDQKHKEKKECKENRKRGETRGNYLKKIYDVGVSYITQKTRTRSRDHIYDKNMQRKQEVRGNRGNYLKKYMMWE